MPRLTALAPVIATRSEPPHAATAWARLLHPRSARAGRRPRSAAADEIRERYAARLARLRSATFAVTSATTGWTGRTGRGTVFSSRFAGGPERGHGRTATVALASGVAPVTLGPAT